MNRRIARTLEGMSTSVLVVDDEIEVRTILSRWLAGAGYDCHTASGVQEAVHILDSQKIDLLTTDIKMPGMTGDRWLPTLLEQRPSLPVLMMTGCDDARLANCLLKQGASAYLLKPISRDQFLQELEQAFEKKLAANDQAEKVLQLETQLKQISSLLHASAEETTERLVATSLLHHDETGEHARRLGFLSEIVARGLGWADNDAKLIRLAAPMHDIGKVGIPDHILRKPGPLTADEFRVMKTHTTLGASILSGTSSMPMLEMAQSIALSHHERWNGSGYPFNIRGADIPVSARIVAIVDVFDALIHDRTYRPALPVSEALHILRVETGSHFDPRIAECFFDVLPQIRTALAELPVTPAENRPLLPVATQISCGARREAVLLRQS